MARHITTTEGRRRRVPELHNTVDAQFLATLHTAAATVAGYVPDVGDLAKSAMSEAIVTLITERRHARTVRELQTEVHRQRDTLASLAAEAETLKAQGRWNPGLADRESGDPGFSQFVADAMQASAETRSVPKQLLLGRFIAHRLQVSSDKDAIMLSRALRTVRDLSEEPLVALACIVLLADLGNPSDINGEIDRAERWLADRCGALLTRIEPLPWQCDDLDTLESVGATTIDNSAATSVFDGGAHVHAVDQWLAQIGVAIYPSEDAGSPEARERFARLYPTITQLSRLAAGHEINDSTRRDFRLDNFNRLDSCQPTPLGFALGTPVLEQLCRPSGPSSGLEPASPEEHVETP